MAILTLCDICEMKQATEAIHHIKISNYAGGELISFDLCKGHFITLCEALPRFVVEKLKTQQIARDKETLP